MFNNKDSLNNYKIFRIKLEVKKIIFHVKYAYHKLNYHNTSIG